MTTEKTPMEKTSVEKIRVTADEDGMRLDRWFKKNYPEVPFGMVNKLLRKGNIRVDGGRAKGDTHISKGQEIRVPPFQLEDRPKIKREVTFTKEDIYFIKDIILYEDNHLFIINKPIGYTVQGGTKSNARPLDKLAKAYFEQNEDNTAEPRLVHRLDKDTSGVLIFAKTRKVAQELTFMFQQKKIKKQYLVICAGVPPQSEGLIDFPLSKTEHGVVVDLKEGKKAVTEFEVLDHAGKKACLIKAFPETGRTHQIRVHLAEIGNPILGDDRYFDTRDERFEGMDFDNLCLHSYETSFRHPVTGKNLVIRAPIPKTFMKNLDVFGFDSKEYLG